MEWRTISGVWLQSLSVQNINVLELRRVHVALQHIKLWQNEGGTRSFHLYQICRQKMLWCQIETRRTVRHVPRKHNLVADSMYLIWASFPC